MNITVTMLLTVCPLAFLAGFVDASAGGGGLISLPAYYLAGLPPVLAAGTNKLSASLGTMASSARFAVSRRVNAAVALLAACGAFPGSWLGTELLRHIPEQSVRVMMLVLIPMAALVVLWEGRQLGAVRRIPAGAVKPVSLLIGFAVGFYDGLVGPGTGTFLILLFTTVLGLEAVTASGTAKLVNLTSNIAALAALMAAGQVLWLLGLPAAACGVAGNLLGAGMTIRRGSRFIRRMLMAALALLLAKMLLDVVK